MAEKGYHLIGIGGIGMSSLARLLQAKQKNVSGSDVSDKGLVKELIREGIEISLRHEEKNVKTPEAVIYSSAIDRDNPEILEAKRKNIPLLHRSEMLRSIMDDYSSLLVAGTHGKTSTSALLATVLKEAEMDPSFSVGGIIQNYNTNAHLGKGKYFVAEADESDGSFLRMEGIGGIITSVEPDHLDYWKSPERYIEGLESFSKKNIINHDLLFWCGDDPTLQEIMQRGVSYGFSDGCDAQIISYRVEEATLVIDLVYGEKTYCEIKSSLIGKHHALNCAAVFVLALALGIEEEKIRKALFSFGGVERRMSLIGRLQEVSFYEDYAHHPSEIETTLTAFRELIEERRLVAIFQPHRYSRTRDFLEDFAKSFDEVDHLFLLDVYSAGEGFLEGGSTQDLYEAMLERKKPISIQYLSGSDVNEVVKFLKPHDRIIALGAGNINSIARDIYGDFQKQRKKLNIGLLFGGQSEEHDIAITSAKFIDQQMDKSLYDLQYFSISKEGNWSKEKQAIESFSDRRDHKIPMDVLSKLLKMDICLPVFHGPRGEDGMIHAFLETLGLAHAGGDYASAALAMNKAQVKKVVSFHGLPTAPFISFSEIYWKRNKKEVLQTMESRQLLPLFVKPVHQGSSIGIFQVNSPDALEEKIDAAFSYDEEVMLEKKVLGRELEFGVIGNEYIHVSHPGEILTHGKFYSYEEKCVKSTFEITDHADLTDEIAQEGKRLAEKVYVAAGCKGFARVDFFLDENNQYYFNEINPIPGFTSISLFPKMMERYRWKPKEMIDRLIFLAMHAKRKRDKV